VKKVFISVLISIIIFVLSTVVACTVQSDSNKQTPDVLDTTPEITSPVDTGLDGTPDNSSVGPTGAATPTENIPKGTDNTQSTPGNTGMSTPTPTPKPTPKPTAKPTPTPVSKDPTVTFSKNGGVYKTRFDLTLTADNGYTIYYTTDGSDPRTSTTKKTYTSAITISQSMGQHAGPLTVATSSALGFPVPSSQIIGTVVKAYAVKGNLKTPVVTNSYFVSSSLVATYDMPIVSISTKKEDFTTKTGIYVTVMQNPYDTKERIVGYVEFFDETGTKQTGQYIQISMNGNGSLANHMKSMRLYFKKDADPSVDGNPGKLKYDIFQGAARDTYGNIIDSFDRILLRNSGNDCPHTMIRDAFMQKASASMNVDYLEARPVLVFVNGEFWGMYNARERYDDKYFNAHYGILEDNIAILEAPTPLKPNNGKYEVNEGNPGDEKPWEELIKYATSHNLAIQEYFDYVASQVDLDSLVDHFIANMYFANTDWPGNNVKVWRNKNENDPSGFDTKWRFLIQDMDYGCGFGASVSTDMFRHTLASSAGAVVVRLFNACLKNPQFKQDFYDRFMYVLDNIYTEEKLISIIDSMAAERKSGIAITAQRWSGGGLSTSNFNSGVEGLRSFVRQRGAYVKTHMRTYLNISTKEITVNYQENIGTVSFNGEKIESGFTTTFDTGEKIKITVGIKSGYSFVGIGVTTADGAQKLYTDTTITLSPVSRTTITVLAKKKNLTTTPKIVTGPKNVYYLTANGNLYAWGDNSKYQSGMVTNSILKKALIASNVIDVATSQGGNSSAEPYVLILTDDGTVYSFGSNSYGQLGRSGDPNVMLPVVLPDVNSKVKAVSCGLDHTLILFENGELYGVGNNTYGQLGPKNVGSHLSSFVKIADNVTTMSAARRHTLFISNGKAYGLGDNRWYKLAATSTAYYSTPVEMHSNARAVIAGEHSSFIIDNNNDLYYIGWRNVSNFNSGAGDGKLHKIMSNVKSVSMQEDHALIVTMDNKCYGWGLNTYSQTAPGSTAIQTNPYLLGSDIIEAGAGAWFSVMLEADGDIVIWGKNTSAISGTGIASERLSKLTLGAAQFK